MPSVSFATYCYYKDIVRMHTPGFLRKLRDQHQHSFCETLLVEQNCIGIQPDEIIDVPDFRIVKTEHHPNIYQEYGITYPDLQAEIFYDGPDEPHYWPKHTINLLVAGKEMSGDYIVFSDSDITIERNINPGWIDVAIDCLNKYQDVLLVCPGEGTVGRNVPEGSFTHIMSQQLFLMKRDEFLAIDLNMPFPYTRETIPDKYKGPMAQYFFMMEGRIGRYMIDKGLHRLILDSSRWRYWHHNPASVDMFGKVKI